MNSTTISSSTESTEFSTKQTTIENERSSLGEEETTRASQETTSSNSKPKNDYDVVIIHQGDAELQAIHYKNGTAVILGGDDGPVIFN